MNASMQSFMSDDEDGIEQPKRQLNLVKRSPTFLMGGNMFLINKVLAYLPIKDVLTLMSVDCSTRIALKNNNQFWFDYYKIMKFGKVQNRYTYQHKGAICYGCLDYRYRNRPPPNDFWLSYNVSKAGITRHMIETLKDVAVTGAELLLIHNKCYKNYIETKVFKGSPTSYTRYMYGLSLKCGKDHWIRMPYYSRKYRETVYDSGINYFNLCLMSMVDTKKFSVKYKNISLSHKYKKRTLLRYKEICDSMQSKFDVLDKKLDRLNRIKDYYENTVMKELNDDPKSNGKSKLKKAPRSRKRLICHY
jgi:hypothetical protein